MIQPSNSAKTPPHLLSLQARSWLHSSVPHAAGEPAQHFALIRRRGKALAVPLEWFFAYKRERGGGAAAAGAAGPSVERAQQAARAEEQRSSRIHSAFQRRFHVTDDGGGALRWRWLAGLSAFGTWLSWTESRMTYIWHHATLVRFASGADKAAPRLELPWIVV